LGLKKLSTKLKCPLNHAHTDPCYYQYPVDVDYFVIEPKWAPKLGEKPKALSIMLAFPTLKQNFDTKAAVYQANGSKWCYTDDDETAYRWTDYPGKDPKTGEAKKMFGYQPMPCPNKECPYRQNGKCPERGSFEFMIPDTGEVGTFFMRFGTKIGISQFYATLSSIEGFVKNRPNGMHGLRMIMRRELVVINRDVKGDGVIARVEKWIPKLEIDFPALSAEDKHLLGPLMGQTIALPEAQQPEDLESGDEDEEDDKAEKKEVK
jgi:hypothetical protein